MLSDFREFTITPGDIDISIPFSTDGLADPGQSRTDISVLARVEFTDTSLGLIESLRFRLGIEPRPVILVHGWGSTAGAWDHYVDGFLPSIGLRGFAVHEMLTGGGDNDGFGWLTNTIDENARVMDEYIQDIVGHPDDGKIRAEQIDVVAHSMGGLISRRYITRHMPYRSVQVRQLIMLGTPNLGSVTAEVGVRGHAELEEEIAEKLEIEIVDGWRYPATTELTTSYLRRFNQDNYSKHGARFYVIAGYCGIPSVVFDNLEAPCNPIEPWTNDMIVSHESALGLNYLDGGWINFGSLDPLRIPPPLPIPGYNEIRHAMAFNQDTSHINMMNDVPEGGRAIFEEYVKPLLQGRQPSRAAAVSADNNRLASASTTDEMNQLQYTDVQAAMIYPSQHIEFSIKSEDSDRMTFAVMGITEQITVSLRSPDGQVITAVTDDPQVQYMQMPPEVMPLTTYTISNPVIGDWTAIVSATAQTPISGTAVAALGSLVSDFQLTIPEMTSDALVNEPLYITARLENGGIPVTGATLQARLTQPGDMVSNVTLRDDGQHGDGAANDGVYGYELLPDVTGLYSAMITVSSDNQGTAVDRSAIWSVSVVEEMQASGTNIYLPLVRR
jgi:pimeloyl-ACP methyl ester carboxylesterase